MEPKHSAETLEHIEKQSELLTESYRAMSHELHKLRVEEEMLMRKLYETMSSEGLLKKNKGNGSSQEIMKHFDESIDKFRGT
ncbi:hypothetical protein LUZ60_005689 [Juncus effusus]|nr:hypothetical protein LUZ60_005689 [Juncus effusus]